MKHVKHKIISKKSINFIDIPIKTLQTKDNKTKGTYESVSEITSIAVPAYYQYIKTGIVTVFERLVQTDKTLKLSIKKPEDILKISNKYCSMQTGYIYKLNQITKYTWLTKDNLKACVTRLQGHISESALYEIPVKYAELKYKKTIIGFINCSDKRINWMFKCSDKITSEHIIQFAICAYINEMKYNRQSYKKLDKQKLELLQTRKKSWKSKDFYNFGKKIIPIIDEMNNYNKSYRIMNILTHEIIEIQLCMCNVEQVLNLLLETKYGTSSSSSSDDEFIKSMLDKSKMKL